MAIEAVTGGGQAARPPGMGKRMVGLLLGLAGLALLVLVVAPNLASVLGIEEGHGRLVDSGIEAGAWFYTDVERVPLAESHVRGAAQRRAAPD